jgi:hypothetical protein
MPSFAVARVPPHEIGALGLTEGQNRARKIENLQHWVLLPQPAACCAAVSRFFLAMDRNIAGAGRPAADYSLH